MIDARAAFASQFDVPRETLDLFDTYADLLTEWQTRFNLVGPSTLPVLWSRHFADSAQLLQLAGPGKSWLDVGAGAGFPGLVIALLDPTARVTLVESIAKKCRFLTEVVQHAGLEQRVMIENRRIESLPSSKFDVITARALAGLSQLFEWCLPYAGSGSRWILPKGVRVHDEVALALRGFAFEHALVPSLTDADARIVVATGVKRR
ncbi:16S rRNA (guanine(527)-N(7))-methyltransferase RsmG [Sandarakinorhabdus sp. DWP1-3-1]|uniref:16S rRNA (guanine(527)-N(7))-methyltransferase RsmG n=1 Tax=Sandarakinorhabdus sp. DWP1-3-1 TaxID=2804627 RepID=UPI003CF42CDE